MQIYIPQNRTKMILRMLVLILIMGGLSWLFWLGPLGDKHELKAEFARYALPPLTLWILVWGGWVIFKNLPILKADQNGIYLHELFKSPRQVPWSAFTHMTLVERQNNFFLQIHFKDDTRAFYNVDRLFGMPYVFMISHRNIEGGLAGLEKLAQQIVAIPEARHLALTID